jgi:hypothetical protein
LEKFRLPRDQRHSGAFGRAVEKLSVLLVQHLNHNSNSRTLSVAWDLSERGNALALAHYGPSFQSFVEGDPAKLEALDIRVETVEGAKLPLINQGSNNYSTRAGLPQKLNAFIEPQIPVDAFLVVPEALQFVAPVSGDLGVASALRNNKATNALNIIYPWERLKRRKPRLRSVRAFESHHSLGTYCELALDVLRQLNIGPFEAEVLFAPRDYSFDIGGRFLDAPVTAYFPCDTHIFSENTPEDQRNTGIDRTYKNANAPIKASLLLIGDSHSYSALCQILSCVFAQVRFIWATRRNQYAPFSDLIAPLAEEADFVVEEISERFFLANFCDEA